MKIRIHVTKEIYRKAMMCWVGNRKNPGSNCAIALAVREVAPRAHVGYNEIYWTPSFTSDGRLILNKSTLLPGPATSAIFAFDSLIATPIDRLALPEFSFEVDFPDELVNEIGINEVHKILSESETLELAQ